MDAKELRVGNYVNVDNFDYHPIVTKEKTILKVAGISMNNNGYSISLNTLDITKQIISPFMAQYTEFIKPITLTEDWWTKWGYECIQEFVTVLIDNSEIPLTLDFEFWVPYIKSLPIHKIQNLFYVLTGKELEITL